MEGMPIVDFKNNSTAKRYGLFFTNKVDSDFAKSSDRSKKVINIYWGQAESANNTRILSNLAPRKFKYESTDGIIREYGSVEHAYQSNKNGKFDKVTYDAYVAKGGYGVKIAPKLTEVGKRGNLQLMKDLVVESFVQNPTSEAVKKLLQYDEFTHNTNELIDKAFLEGIKLAKQELHRSKKNTIVDRVAEGLSQITSGMWDKVIAERKLNKGQLIKELTNAKTDSDINEVYEALGFGQESNLSEKNIFTVEPIQSVDKKAKSKAKIATQYIGFAEGIAGSSTAEYARQISEQSKKVEGINISSRATDKLGKRLTNPNWYAKDLMDVEAPYKANASKIKAPHLNAEEALKYDMNLMYKLQVQKFQKNPELIDEINERGGLEFIKQSSHVIGVKNSRWEGEGMNSNFIKVLSRSYTTVAKELNKFKERNSNIVNSGNYSSSDVIFVSIGGKRGSETIRKQQQDRTIKEAIKALEAGATLITDNATYVESNSYNEGEKRLAANLKVKGYNYSEIVIDGHLLGVWNKNTNQITPQLSSLSDNYIVDQVGRDNSNEHDNICIIPY
jgi:hypothetical protein